MDAPSLQNSSCDPRLNLFDLLEETSFHNQCLVLSRLSFPTLWNLAGVSVCARKAALFLLKQRFIDLEFKQVPQHRNCLILDVHDTVRCAIHRLKLSFNGMRERRVACQKFRDTLLFLLRSCRVNTLTLVFVSMYHLLANGIKSSIVHMPMVETNLDRLCIIVENGGFHSVVDRLCSDSLDIFSRSPTETEKEIYNSAHTTFSTLLLLSGEYWKATYNVDRLFLNIKSPTIGALTTTAWSVQGISSFIKQWMSGKRCIEHVRVLLRLRSEETAADLIDRIEAQVSLPEGTINGVLGDKVTDREETPTISKLKMPYPARILQSLRSRFPSLQDVEKCYGKLRVEQKDGTRLYVTAEAVGNLNLVLIYMLIQSKIVDAHNVVVVSHLVFVNL